MPSRNPSSHPSFPNSNSKLAQSHGPQRQLRGSYQPTWPCAAPAPAPDLDPATTSPSPLPSRDENSPNKFRPFPDRIPFFLTVFEMVRIFSELDLRLVGIGIRIRNDLGRIPTKFHITIFLLELFYITIFEIIQKSE
jgi:hypothetical protein